MTTPRAPLFAGYCYPGELTSYAVWLYSRFPLSFRMVEEMLAARGIAVTDETIRQWSLKFGREFANRIRQRAPRRGDKWHLDEIVLTIAGKKHWLWRAVDQEGFVLDVLVQSRRDKTAAKRLLRKLLRKQGRAPRVLITDKLKGYAAAKREIRFCCKVRSTAQFATKKPRKINLLNVREATQIRTLQQSHGASPTDQSTGIVPTLTSAPISMSRFSTPKPTSSAMTTATTPTTPARA
jgi:transposase-like protein